MTLLDMPSPPISPLLASIARHATPAGDSAAPACPSTTSRPRPFRLPCPGQTLLSRHGMAGPTRPAVPDEARPPEPDVTWLGRTRLPRPTRTHPNSTRHGKARPPPPAETRPGWARPGKAATKRQDQARLAPARPPPLDLPPHGLALAQGCRAIASRPPLDTPRLDRPAILTRRGLPPPVCPSSHPPLRPSRPGCRPRPSTHDQTYAPRLGCPTRQS